VNDHLADAVLDMILGADHDDQALSALDDFEAMVPLTPAPAPAPVAPPPVASPPHLETVERFARRLERTSRRLDRALRYAWENKGNAGTSKRGLPLYKWHWDGSDGKRQRDRIQSVEPGKGRQPAAEGQKPAPAKPAKPPKQTIDAVHDELSQLNREDVTEEHVARLTAGMLTLTKQQLHELRGRLGLPERGTKSLAKSPLAQRILEHVRGGGKQEPAGKPEAKPATGRTPKGPDVDTLGKIDRVLEGYAKGEGDPEYFGKLLERLGVADLRTVAKKVEALASRTKEGLRKGITEKVAALAPAGQAEATTPVTTPATETGTPTSGAGTRPATAQGGTPRTSGKPTTHYDEQSALSRMFAAEPRLERMPTTPVTIMDMMHGLPPQQKESLSKALFDLADRGIVALHRQDNLNLLRPEERANLLHDPESGMYFTAVAFRDPDSAPKPDARAVAREKGTIVERPAPPAPPAPTTAEMTPREPPAPPRMLQRSEAAAIEKQFGMGARDSGVDHALAARIGFVADAVAAGKQPDAGLVNQLQAWVKGADTDPYGYGQFGSKEAYEAATSLLHTARNLAQSQPSPGAGALSGSEATASASPPPTPAPAGRKGTIYGLPNAVYDQLYEQLQKGDRAGAENALREAASRYGIHDANTKQVARALMQQLKEEQAGPAKPTVPASTPKSAPSVSGLATAFRDLDSKGFNQVSLDKLAEKTGYTPEQLHGVVRDLIKKGVLSGQGPEGRHGLSDRERRAMIPSQGPHDPGVLYVSVRPGMEREFERLTGQGAGTVATPTPVTPAPSSPQRKPTAQPRKPESPTTGATPPTFGIPDLDNGLRSARGPAEVIPLLYRSAGTIGLVQSATDRKTSREVLEYVDRVLPTLRAPEVAAVGKAMGFPKANAAFVREAIEARIGGTIRSRMTEGGAAEKAAARRDLEKLGWKG